MKKVTHKARAYRAGLTLTSFLALSLLFNCDVAQRTECLGTGAVVRVSSSSSCLVETDGSAPVDPEFPAFDSSIVVTSRAAKELGIQWELATDTETAQADLEYLVVYTGASNSALLTVDAAKGPLPAEIILVKDWSKNISTATLSGLLASTTYYTTVYVRDGDGNITMLSPKEVSTSEEGAPTIGTGIAFSNITPSGVTVAWGAASDPLTPTAQLEYRLVRAATAGEIDSLAEIKGSVAAGVTVVQDWTAGLTSLDVTGLTSSTTYHFAVVVRGAASNYSFYDPASVQILDQGAPTVGTGIVYSNATSSSLLVSWGAGSDDSTVAAGLQYKLVRAGSAAAIDTVDEIQAITGPALEMDWTTAVLSKNVTGLSEFGTYAFAVLVRDGSGNMSLYSPAASTTLDVTKPLPGTGLVFTNINLSSVTATWGAGTDPGGSGNLQYKLVRAAASTSIDDVTEADAVTGSGLVMNWSPALTISATGLDSLTTYYFAVLVRDAAGNKEIYSPPASVLSAGYIFVTAATSTGDLSSGGFGTAPVAAADARCQADSKHPDAALALGARRPFKAVFSYVSTNANPSRVACTNANCAGGIAGRIDWSLQPDATYRLSTTVVVKKTNDKGVFVFPLTAAVGTGADLVWTGLQSDFTSLTSDTCGDWVDANPGLFGGTGLANQTSTIAISTGNTTCSQPARLYCAEQP